MIIGSAKAANIIPNKNNIGVAFSGNGNGTEKLWESTATGEEEGMQNGDVIIAGERFQTGHELIGATPTKIVFNLRKTGSATGTAELKLIDSSNTEKASFGTVDMDTLDASFASTTLTNSENTETIADGDRIAWHYSNAGAFRFQVCSSCSENYTNESYYVSSWNNRSTVCSMEVWGIAA